MTVTTRRTTQDTADFLWNYCMDIHHDVVHIHLVLDNLNTHKEKALRNAFGDTKSVQFFARVTLHFTPYPASWLNMGENEISCLRTQGLKQRIANDVSMRKIVTGIVTERNMRHAHITWGFTKEKAGRKFPTLYGIN